MAFSKSSQPAPVTAETPTDLGSCTHMTLLYVLALVRGTWALKFAQGVLSDLVTEVTFLLAMRCHLLSVQAGKDAGLA